MNESKLATLAPTKKSAIVRARLTEICAAVARGCSYEEIARALAAETNIVISRTALREYVDRELKKRNSRPDTIKSLGQETKNPGEPQQEPKKVEEYPRNAPVEPSPILSFSDVSKLMRKQINPDQYSRKRNRQSK